LAIVFVGGGMLGGLAGARAASILSTRKGALNMAVAGLIVLVAVYMAAATATSFF
jgi:hypothetical protein